MSAHLSARQERGEAICRSLPASTGIYIIWFDGLSRAYIGQSSNIAHRVRTHLYEMETFKGHKMRGDLDTMGWGRLNATALETAQTCEALHLAETRWMNKYRNSGWSLYNHDATGKVHRDRARAR